MKDLRFESNKEEKAKQTFNNKKQKQWRLMKKGKTDE